MKSKFIAILLCVVFVFSLAGCAECISTEYENVEVTVVGKYHRGAWLQPVIVCKLTTFITHPEEWRITVEYNGVEYTVNGHDTYDKYEDKIGQTTTGEFEIKTYDDGTVKYDIVSLK